MERNDLGSEPRTNTIAMMSISGTLNLKISLLETWSVLICVYLLEIKTVLAMSSVLPSLHMIQKTKSEIQDLTEANKLK